MITPPNKMDAEQVLLKVLRKVASEQKYDNPRIEITPVTTKGANYTSAIYTATIAATGKDVLNLFAKVATMGEEMRTTIKADRLFENERFTYMELSNTYDRIQDKYGVSKEDRLVFPKFYAYHPEKLRETLVLENLTDSGYEAYSRLKSMDWNYASQAVTELAKFHALSFAYKLEDPESFEKVIGEKTYVMASADQDETARAMFEKLTQCCLMAVEERFRGKLVQFIQGFSDPQQFAKYYTPLRHAVAVHGDYRISNLMSKTKGDGTTDVIPIDYQTIYCGRPTTDLIYFIITGSDQKFRAQHYQRLINLYYEQLGLALRRFNMDVEKIYPRGDFDEEIKDTLPFGLVTAIFTLSLILVEEDNVPELEKAFDGIRVNANELYAERLTGIVEDMLEFGVL